MLSYAKDYNIKMCNKYHTFICNQGNIFGLIQYYNLFCLRFRWLENLDVASRSLTLIPSIREYCVQAKPSKTEPKQHEGYKLVEKAVTSDQLLRAKHLFWISVAQDFQPFLKLYQAERPLIPFLASDLEALLRIVMARFVKETEMAGATSFVKLTEIDISGDNVKSAKSVDVGIATKRELASLLSEKKITAKQELQFMAECKEFLIRSTEKLLQKCPLKYKIVRCLRCLDPRIMAGSVESSVKLFGRLLNCLIDAKRVKEMDADGLKREYQQFVTETIHGSPQTLLQFKNYDKVNGERLDSLLAGVLKDNSRLEQLWELLKSLLVLSHGQAGVERGFSINSEVMEVNFTQKSVIALRTIYDHIQQCGGVLNVSLDQDIRNAARNASSVYRAESKLKWRRRQKKKS